jgi:flagellar biogenesis protein FliO
MSGRDIALRCPRPRNSGRNEFPESFALGIAPLLNAARTAQRAIPTKKLVRTWPMAGLLAILFLAAFDAAADSVVSTNMAAMPSALPDTGASVFRVLGALILVIAIFFSGVWLFRNWQRFTVQKGGGAKLNLIEVKSLGQRQALYVVGYQQQRMLLASSPTGVTLVSHLPAAEEVEAEAPAPKLSFAEAFQHVLSRKQ